MDRLDHLSVTGTRMPAAAVLRPIHEINEAPITLGGLVIAQTGVAYVDWINAVSYGAVLIALVLMGSVAQQSEIDAQRLADVRREPVGAFVRSAGEGVQFVLKHPVIFPTVLLDFLAAFFSSAMALLPLFARDILNVGAVPAFSGPIRRQGSVLIAAVGFFGLATIVFGLSRSF